MMDAASGLAYGKREVLSMSASRAVLYSALWITG
jgi:hypothetical protein